MAALKGTRPPAAGRGRPKGAKNKMTAALKDMILGALDEAGGQEYLVEQARKNPAAFLTLLGKVLPLQVAGSESGPIEISVVRYDVDTGGPRPMEGR
jgi:hypothetical protein